MLSSLQLRPISTSHYYLSGDVVIGSGVAIAPGVLIQADPHTQVIIHPGVVIGSGTVIHANQGSIEIGSGAIIGAEVLLIGSIEIGAQVCIGAASTIFHRPALVGKAALHIAAGELIPPGSLLGDRSREAETTASMPDHQAAKATTPSAGVGPPMAASDPSATVNHYAAVNGNAAVNGRSGDAVNASAQGASGFAAAATHGFVSVPQAQAAAIPDDAGDPVNVGSAYFHAPPPTPPDLPYQPFTENPPPRVGTPPPPTSVPPAPSYPGPFTMPKADVPPPMPAPTEKTPASDSLATQPSTNESSTNGAGTVSYVNQMLGRMFPHRASNQQT